MIQAILNKLFNKVDIIVNGDPNAPIYLRRWFIYPRKPQDNKFEPRIYLHRFFTGDNVRDLHDHPWAYQSIILKGGYWEHSFNPAWLKWQALIKENETLVEIARAGKLNSLTQKEWQRAMMVPLIVGMHDQNIPKTVKKWYGPGRFLKRGASWAHAVELAKDEHGNDKPCWSIIYTGIKSRSWGFHTSEGWCWWRNYHNGACVCYDNPNEEISSVKI